MAFHPTATEPKSKASKITSNRKWTKHLDEQVEIQKCGTTSRGPEREYVTLPKPAPLFQYLQKCQQLRGESVTTAPGSQGRNRTFNHHRSSPRQNSMPKLRTKNEYVNEGCKSGSFVNKPARGWLHPDRQILEEGVCYQVRYVGCLEINTSMKSLDFETRSQVAKECINKICETAELKMVDRKHKVDRRVSKMLKEIPNMNHSHANVHLIINSASLVLRVMETSEVIANHEMPNISFASGGDVETADFVAYVAKDQLGKRACYVIECGGKWAQDVITTIGQAFELRFKEYMQKSTQHDAVENLENSSSLLVQPLPADTSDPEYYNDLPGKIPPELGITVPSFNETVVDSPRDESCPEILNQPYTAKDLSPNLIDFNSELASPDHSTKKSFPEYVNDDVWTGALDTYNAKDLVGINQCDPFDMQPFDASLPSSNLKNISQDLEKEEWFHGMISRKQAEALLRHDGEFLVRESQGSPMQYVLTGMHNGITKHLLLVDPCGLVRTKDKKFDNISHLVRYHQNNGLPIISAESALMLRTPVPKK